MLHAGKVKHPLPSGEAVTMSLLYKNDKQLFVATPSRYDLVIGVRNEVGADMGYAGYNELVADPYMAQRLDPQHNYIWSTALPEGWYLKPTPLAFF